MDIEEPRKGARDLMSELASEDLELLSREALAERIALLRAEIARVEAAMAKKASSQLAAEAFFRKI